MTNDARTANRNYPKPHADNLLSADMARLIQALEALDVDVAGLLTAVAGRALLAHGHAISDVSGLQAALDGKKAASWLPTLDDLSDVNVTGAASGQFLRLIGSAWQPSTISVAWGDVSAKPASFPTTWGDVAGKPATFTPSTHGHAISEVVGLQAVLDGKMSALPGSIAIQGNAYPHLLLNKTASGGTGYLRGLTNGNPRWQVKLGDETAEAGGDLGSNFVLQRITDGGSYVDALTIFRNTGWAVFKGNLEVVSAHIFTRNADDTQHAFLTPDGALELKAPFGAYIDFKRTNNDFEFRIQQSPVGSELNFNRSDGKAVAILNAFSGFYGASIGAPDIGQISGIFRRQGGDEGGEIHLEKPATNTSLAAHVSIDVYRNQLRFFEAGGAVRGIHLDLTTLPSGVGTIFVHSANIGQMLAALAHNAVGAFGMMRGGVGAVAEGANYAGSSLFWTNTINSSAGGTASGTWRAHGRTNASNEATLFQRVA